MEEAWHSLDAEVAMKKLGTGRAGLGRADAAERLLEYGPNELQSVQRESPFKILLRQFADTLVVILIIAAGISFLVGETVDAVLILVIVIISAVLGFTQEYQAERALEALRKMLTPSATVLRDNQVLVVPTRDIVSGDLLILKEGDKITADGRLVDAINMKVNEAVITGESVPVLKSADVMTPDTPLPDRKNMVLSGTEVAYGKGLAVVTSTGMNTEFGKIARQVTAVVKEETPLEKRTKEIGKWLGGLSLGVCVGVIAVGLIRDFLFHGWFDPTFALEMILFGIALAVAAVPEALPAVVTGSLAIGMHRMAKANALVRRMSAVETLGCTTVICSDKTGTITKGEMTAREIYIAGSTVSIEGEGYDPTGRVLLVDGVQSCECFELFVKGCVLCNDAELVLENGKWRIRGDPTEGALVVLAEKAGHHVAELRSRYPRIGEVPFSSERKRMTTMHYSEKGGKLVFVKGAPEVVLERCTKESGLNGVKEMTTDSRMRIQETNETMAKNALRVLAIAYREGPQIDDSTEDTLERELTFLGSVGMIDPARAEAIQAISVCKSVGIRPIMITGDHALTAMAIAREVGIYRDGDRLLTDAEMERIPDQDFEQIVEEVSVYARVSPIRKLKIVQAWKKRGEIVAMTGDGVNDAPALKQADIGIAMGITGTDVTKETADLVLADDNFATIEKAIEIGRWIFDNIRKYLAYLLQANLVEIIVLSACVLMGYPLPLTAAQLLYINLVTDGFPAIALGLSPPDPDLMQRPPRDPKESIFSKEVKLFYLRSVLIETPLLLFVFMSMVPMNATDAELMAGRSLLFYLFVFVELVMAMTCRSLKYTVWHVRPHRLLWIAVLGTALFTVGLFSIPAAAAAFKIAPISLLGAEVLVSVCALTLISVETIKYLLRRGNLLNGTNLVAAPTHEA